MVYLTVIFNPAEAIFYTYQLSIGGCARGSPSCRRVTKTMASGEFHACEFHCGPHITSS